MKKFCCLLALLLCLFALPQAAYAADYAVIDTNTLNVRSGAGTSYDKVGTASRGEEYLILNESGGWYQIQFDKKTQGWVTGQYVKTTSDATLPGTVTISGSTAVNVRAGAGTSYPISGSIAAPATVAVTGESGYWWKVESGATSGYIAKWVGYANFDGSTVTNPTTPGTIPTPGTTPTTPGTTTPGTTAGEQGSVSISKNEGKFRRGSDDNGDYFLATAIADTVMYEEPEEDAEEVEDFRKGAELRIYERDDEWYWAADDDDEDITGWVHKDDLRINGSMSGSAATPAATAPVYKGSASQGTLYGSYRQTAYGYELSFESNNAIIYSTLSGKNFIRIETDMHFDSGLPMNSGLIFTVSGATNNVLTISTSGAISAQTELSPDHKKLTVTVGSGSIAGNVIYIDPGHGGYNSNDYFDAGAVQNGYYESTIVYNIAQMVQSQLQAKGATVYLTRGETTDITNKERAKMANAADADIFVSIHLNSAASGAAKGCSTWFYAPKDDDFYDRSKRQALAECIQDGVLDSTGMSDYGIYESSLIVLNYTAMPAVLVEAGFLSNPDEAKKLATTDFQKKIATGIVDGIMEYFANI